jgi:hypothetical protein
MLADMLKVAAKQEMNFQTYSAKHGTVVASQGATSNDAYFHDCLIHR